MDDQKEIGNGNEENIILKDVKLLLNEMLDSIVDKESFVKDFSSENGENETEDTISDSDIEESKLPISEIKLLNYDPLTTDQVRSAISSPRWDSNTLLNQDGLETPINLKFMLDLNYGRYKSKAVRKFKSIAHSIILWLRLYYYHSNQIRELLKFFSDIDLRDEKSENEQNLLFSKDNFKPNKQARVNRSTLLIMKKDPSERTSIDNKPIEAGLIGYEAFREFPTHILKKIAQKAIYQQFKARSVILREGDFPMYYYFIIYGQVLVSVIDQQRKIANVMTTLGRGESFGELALVNRTRRQSSVVCKEECGLLLLEDTDYKDIFMNGGIEFLDNSLVKNHVAFNGFDLNVLKNHPSDIKLSYFSPGTNVIENNKLSDWILLIISGKCLVKMAVPKKHQHENAHNVLKTWDTEKTLNLHHQLLQDLKSNKISQETFLRREWRVHLRQLDARPRIAAMVADAEINQLKVPKTSFKEELSLLGSEMTQISLKHDKITPILTGSCFIRTGSVNQSQTSNSSEKAGKLVQYTVDGVKGRRTVATDLNTEFYKDRQLKLLLGEEPEEFSLEFLPVQLLTRGMLFGVTDQFFDKQPSLKVVSEGSELLCIRKSLYLDNAGEITLFNLANTLRPYPSENDIMEKSDLAQNWRKNKSHAYKDSLKNVTVKLGEAAKSRFPLLTTHNTSRL